MRSFATLVLAGLIAVPLGAQDRGRSGDRTQGIPPGHLPPPGECRVWYDGRPPGQQPPPTSCRDAERVAWHDPYARVIYGGNRDRRDDRRERGDDRWERDDRRGRDDGRWDRDDDRRGRDRAVPRDPSRYPDRYPDRRGLYGNEYPAFENGYEDGYDKGREDAREREAYGPTRHDRYRSADHGYQRQHGSEQEYRNRYREGFRAGFDDGYRGDERPRR